MNYSIEDLATKTISEGNFIYPCEIGEIQIRQIRLNSDLTTIHNWVTRPYAKFWEMEDYSYEQTKSTYSELESLPHYNCFIGTIDNKIIFLTEIYDATKDKIAQYYDAKDGDWGMHLLVGPPKQKIKGFTWNIFQSIMEFIFQNNMVKRVIVEPDVRNNKIHVLNKKAGFDYKQVISLPNKDAHLAICEKHRYEFEKRQNNDRDLLQKKEALIQANRRLVCKAIAEFSHELIIEPSFVSIYKSWEQYELLSDNESCIYSFNARVYAMEHWAIDESSLLKLKHGKIEEISIIQFIIELNGRLKIPTNFLEIYLEEISNTLFSQVFKIQHNKISSKKLAKSDFQTIEHSLTEGHPIFIANSGKQGFDQEDFIKYTPEGNGLFQLIWVAGTKINSSFTAISQLNYEQHISEQLSEKEIIHFHQKLLELKVNPNDYLFFPIHPWQWKNKIQSHFSSDIANKKLIFLGKGEDLFSPQQSIRTLFNQSKPSKSYTKTSLSILNMGFMRGLSPYYMESTPGITEWISDLLKDDSYLNNLNFKMLNEYATIGYRHSNFEQLGKTNSLNKMLAVLWRENPFRKIFSHQKIMSMAALLHIDQNKNSFLVELIKDSTIPAINWVKKYLDCYLNPLLHCFYKYELVFMPHGENVILAFENSIPQFSIMKDITEEVLVFNTDKDLPASAKRLQVEASFETQTSSIFTDVFDGFFRFLAQILDEFHLLSTDIFWDLVAENILDYQQLHPELEQRFKECDLFVSHFKRCCLNRLQLNNAKQMLDLNDPIASLNFQKDMRNPIAIIK